MAEAETLISTGSGHLTNGRPDEALLSVDRAVRGNPRLPNSLHWRAEAYLAKGERERAIADYRAALDLNPPDRMRGIIEHSLWQLA